MIFFQGCLWEDPTGHLRFIPIWWSKCSNHAQDHQGNTQFLSVTPIHPLVPDTYQPDQLRAPIWQKGNTCGPLSITSGNHPRLTLPPQTSIFSEQISAAFKHIYREKLQSHSKWRTEWQGFRLDKQSGFLVVFCWGFFVFFFFFNLLLIRLSKSIPYI